MQIDTNTLLYILFAVLGAGYALFSRWAGRVNDKLEELRDQKYSCTLNFISKDEFEQSKDHVWDKLREHDSQIRELMGARR